MTEKYKITAVLTAISYGGNQPTKYSASKRICCRHSCNLIFIFVFTQEETVGSGELTIDYVSFDSRAKDSDGNDCDLCCCFFCSQYCDPIFKICLRYGHSTSTFFCSSSGVVNPQIQSAEYTDTNKVIFGTSINGRVNPVVYSTNNQFDVSILLLLLPVIFAKLCLYF